MVENVWVCLSARERTILLDAVTAVGRKSRAQTDEIDALILKIVRAKSHPKITVGVRRGQVESVLGNPFPIRICDYDGDSFSDVDEQGRGCSIWYLPADKKAFGSGKRKPQRFAGIRS
jgi:hypothetical protein